MIERSEQDGIVTLRLAHGKASAMDLELTQGLTLAFDEAAQSDARAVILTGSGSIFSAGVDLYRVLEGGAAYAETFYPALTRLIFDLFAFPKPLVAAVNGHAIAGGAIMTAVGDVRLMARGNGRIGVPELVVGVAFPPVVLELMRFAVGPGALQSLIYTGRSVQADEARALGLIDEIVDADALMTRAEESARHLASLPPGAFRMAKHELRDPYIRRAKRYAAQHESDALAVWKDPATHAQIREYLARTVGKSAARSG
ncbi:MAG TPA: enoyl-CoA hydratase/isomerase family protein [Thermoanaerobaculia bacterium]|jgi:enoyl-CoA hydratase